MRHTESSKGNLSERLKLALQKTGISQAELARKVGIKPQNIQYLCSKNAEWSKFTFEFAHALGVDAQWLATGEGSISQKHPELTQSTRAVPLLSSQNLQLLSKDFKNLDSITDKVAYTSTEQAEFAFLLDDASMWPRFDIGTLLFFNRSSEIKEKDYALIYISAMDTTLFRGIQKKKDQWILVPFNQTLYKEIPLSQDDQILGLLVEATWRNIS